MSTNNSKKTTPVDTGKLGREIFGLFSIFCGILLVLSLATFDSRDPWLNHVVSGVTKVYNRAGLFGAYLGGMLFDGFGVAAWVLPLFFCILGIRRILASPSWEWWRWTGFLLLTICLSLAGAARDIHLMEVARGLPGAGNISAHGGGLLGHLMYGALVGWLSSTGATLFWIFCFLLAIQMLVGFSWVGVLLSSARGVWKTCTTMAGEVGDAPPPAPQGRPLELEVTTEPLSGEPTPLSRKLFAGMDKEKSQRAGQAATAQAAGTPDEQAEEALPPEFSGKGDPFFPDAGGTQALPPLPDTPKPPSPFFSFGGKAEVDEPEWLRDFETGRIGVTADHELSANPTASQSVFQTFLQAAHEVSPKAASVPAGQTALAEQPSQPAQAAPHAEESAEPPIPIADIPTVERADLPPPEKGIMRLLRKPAVIPLPSLVLVEAAPPSAGSMTRAVLEAKGKSLMTCLTDFGIQCELVGITPGPVVTMFEVRPAPGVRVSRIANLSDDLALALKAVAVRIQAPVPGTDTVGIEIPNEVREIVCFKELVSSRVFQQSASLLTLALGKDISGAAAVADLATMPHLLVAGATGAGKSVGINSILLSILLKARPEQVKLLLIDPKRVEMAIYADLPHLVHPVVTEMAMAKNALEWAVAEMEQRYTQIARAGVRNIGAYNEKLARLGDKRPDEMTDLETMPYLVIVIDELADLMLVAAKEVETSIVRLAQLARAAGIHLVLATQRPSVDVVTGLIKANFPCRISFQVTSKHDSRTILDTVGAENLLGKGDMLFKPPGGKFQRMHGAFVSDKNVNAITDYWRSKQKPEYSLDFSAWANDDGFSGGFGGNGGGDDIAGDPMYAEACSFIRQQDKVSISLIQRRFRIGFNKAARFVEQMEQDGIVTPADGAKPRAVVR